MAFYLYNAQFNAIKKENGLYEIKHADFFIPVEEQKYSPEVEITDINEFSKIIDEIFQTDLMQIKENMFIKMNHDELWLRFDEAIITTSYNNDSKLTWNGRNDEFKYSVTNSYYKRNFPNYTIPDILSLEMPADKIPSDWIKLLEKNEKNYV